MKRLMITLSVLLTFLRDITEANDLMEKRNLYKWYQKYNFEVTLHNKWHI